MKYSTLYKEVLWELNANLQSLVCPEGKYRLYGQVDCSGDKVVSGAVVVPAAAGAHGDRVVANGLDGGDEVPDGSENAGGAEDEVAGAEDEAGGGLRVTIKDAINKWKRAIENFLKTAEGASSDLFAKLSDNNWLKKTCCMLCHGDHELFSGEKPFLKFKELDDIGAEKVFDDVEDELLEVWKKEYGVGMLDSIVEELKEVVSPSNMTEFHHFESDAILYGGAREAFFMFLYDNTKNVLVAMDIATFESVGLRAIEKGRNLPPPPPPPNYKYSDEDVPEDEEDEEDTSTVSSCNKSEED